MAFGPALGPGIALAEGGAASLWVLALLGLGFGWCERLLARWVAHGEFACTVR